MIPNMYFILIINTITMYDLQFLISKRAIFDRIVYFLSVFSDLPSPDNKPSCAK